MELKVNGEHIDITLENESTVGDVLTAFEAEASKHDATTINIHLNGEEIPAEKFDTIIKEPIKDDTLIELTVLNKQSVLDAFGDIKKGFESLTTQMELVPVMIQGGKDSEVNQTIQLLADEIDNFCHTATLCALFPDLYSKIKIDDQDLTSFFENFAPILADFEQAMTDKDTVTVGDLAEYEISPRLTMISDAICTILK